MIIWNKSSEIWRRHEFRVSKACLILYREFVVLGLSEMSIFKNSFLNEFLRYQVCLLTSSLTVLSIQTIGFEVEV